jgi:catechol 2,3-dioxygenase-like lactoylglutathione lyase family enzyme
MKIKLTSVYVDDQEKALRFYTEVLGFVKKADFSQGPYRWLTVASPADPDGTELQLALNDNPAAKAYQQAMFQQSQPAAMFFTDDRAGRLRAYESARRRVHHDTHGRDRLQDRDAERHLRQSHSGHAAQALVGTFSNYMSEFIEIRGARGQRSHSTCAIRHGDRRTT